MVAKTSGLNPGDKFNCWTVLSGPVRHGRAHYYQAICTCGTSKLVEKGALIAGRSTSCGCRRDELASARVKHGKSGTPVYTVWNMMKQRCHVETYKHYEDYGGRGIRVCEEWHTFENFYRDMGDPPFKGASLERLDNTKGYSKDNVVWADRKAQNNNKRNSVRFTYKEKDYTLRELAELSGIKIATLNSRIYLYGMSVKDAVEIPVRTAAEAATLAPNLVRGSGRQEGHKLYG